MRMSGGSLQHRRRSRAAVSPVRTPTVGTCASVSPRVRPRARCPRAARGGSSRRRPPGRGAARCRGRGCAGPGSEVAVGGEPVDRAQERGERLARAGGRQDQRVASLGDRLPAVALGIGGLLERGSNHARAGEKTSSVTPHTLPGDTDEQAGSRRDTGTMPHHVGPRRSVRAPPRGRDVADRRVRRGRRFRFVGRPGGAARRRRRRPGRGRRRDRGVPWERDGCRCGSRRHRRARRHRSRSEDR